MKETNAYLIFNGNCAEAMKFYAKNLGAELQIMPFSEMPGGDYPKEAKDRIMHSRLTKGSAVLMASDNMPGMEFKQGNNFSVSVNCENIPEIEKFFKAFSEKATIKMPLQQTFWAERFGMLIDRYGVHWMFNLDQTKKS